MILHCLFNVIRYILCDFTFIIIFSFFRWIFFILFSFLFAHCWMMYSCWYDRIWFSHAYPLFPSVLPLSWIHDLFFAKKTIHCPSNPISVLPILHISWCVYITFHIQLFNPLLSSFLLIQFDYTCFLDSFPLFFLSFLWYFTPLIQLS